MSYTEAKISEYVIFYDPSFLSRILEGRTGPDIVQVGIGILTVGISILAIYLARRSMLLAQEISLQNQVSLDKQQKDMKDFMFDLQKRDEGMKSLEIGIHIVNSQLQVLYPMTIQKDQVKAQNAILRFEETVKAGDALVSEMKAKFGQSS